MTGAARRPLRKARASTTDRHINPSTTTQINTVRARQPTDAELSVKNEKRRYARWARLTHRNQGPIISVIQAIEMLNETVPRGEKSRGVDARTFRHWFNNTAGEWTGTKAIGDHVSRLKRKGRWRGQSPHRGGRRPGHLTAAQALKDKYEQLSERSFTFDYSNPGENGKPAWWSPPGSRFVALGMRVVFANITPAQIDTVLKKLK